MKEPVVALVAYSRTRPIIRRFIRRLFFEVPLKVLTNFARVGISRSAHIGSKSVERVFDSESVTSLPPNVWERDY